MGRGNNAKTARNSELWPTDVRTDTARCRVACPRLKMTLVTSLPRDCPHKMTNDRLSPFHYVINRDQLLIHCYISLHSSCICTESIGKAMETLLVLGAVEKIGDSFSLTSVGQSMSAFPLDPKLAKVLLASKTYRCSEEVLSIVALLSTGNGSFWELGQG